VGAQLTIFLALAAVGLLSALMVITRRNPVHSALYLIVTFFSVAGVYVVLGAEFLAAVQVLVYAGGIMVLFLFVIMLVESPDSERKSSVHKGHAAFAAGLTMLVVFLLGYHITSAGTIASGPDLASPAAGGNLETVAGLLFRYYLLPFEVVSILLLVAMVGAIVLARPKY
jgi:NADH-quinone oxidoreductase subunit J